MSVHHLLPQLCQAALLTWLAVSLLAQGAAASKYAEAFSKVPWQTFPGGRYKASTNATLTASTISGALVQLNVGGVRELHWHDVDEWAFVLNGTCMGSAIDQGKLHPSDTWNFTFGDLWYFPANVPHVLVGMPPSGCTFLTGYNSPSFNELDAFSASAWLSTVPVNILAQSLGISTAAAQQVLDGSPSKQPQFIAQGNVQELAAAAPSLPLQFPKLIHRYSLMQNTHEVDNGDGSFINMADVTRFPVATGISGALIRIAPGGMRQLHWHQNFDEWQYVVAGSVETGVFLAPGRYVNDVLATGDLGFAPRGSGHFLRNPSASAAADVVLIFNDGLFTNFDVVNFLGAVPAPLVAASLNISTTAAAAMDYTRGGFAPGSPRPATARRH